MIYAAHSIVLSVLCCWVYGLVAMSQQETNPMTQLPHDLWRMLLEDSLPGDNKLLNILVRQFGLHPATADKIIIPYMDRTKLYPYSDEAIGVMLTSFKTSCKGVNLQQHIKRALERYSTKYPLLMALYGRNRAHFRGLAHAQLPCFNGAGTYFNAYLPDPLPTGATGINSLDYIRTHLRFTCVAQAQELRALLIDIAHQIDDCQNLIHHYIGGHMISEAIRDSLFNTYLPGVIAGSGLLMSYIQNVKYLGVASACAATAYTLGRSLWLKKAIARTGAHENGLDDMVMLAFPTWVLTPALLLSKVPLETCLCWCINALATGGIMFEIESVKSRHRLDPVLNRRNPTSYPALLEELNVGREQFVPLIAAIDEYIKKHQS